MMKFPYEPKGRAAVLLDEMRKDRARRWTYAEVAKLLDIQPKAVGATVQNSVRAGLIYAGYTEEARMALSVEPFPEHLRQKPKPMGKVRDQARKPPKEWTPDPTDPRIMRVVPGWTPPKMVCVRLGQ